MTAYKLLSEGPASKQHASRGWLDFREASGHFPSSHSNSKASLPASLWKELVHMPGVPLLQLPPKGQFLDHLALIANGAWIHEDSSG